MSIDVEMTLEQPGRSLARTETVTPMQMIAEASARGDVSIERMAQLFDLQLRWEENEARKAFNTAFSNFKAESVKIVKNVEVKSGPLVGSMYADLYGVSSALTPLLSKHGLSHSWKLTKDEPQWMEVTCIIRHPLGHSESVSMGAAPDAGPGRNAIQARGSTKSYLERYTLLAATGTAAAGTDNDGNGSGLDVDAYVDSIRDTSTKEELVIAFNTAFTAAQKAKNPEAMKSFRAARDKRQAQL